MTQTVKEFIQQSYKIISANSPTVPLQGSDMSFAVLLMNQILSSFSSSSLLLTIARKISFNVAIGQQFVTFGSPTFIPTPDVTQGRLSNLENAWLELQGVTYPLIQEQRGVFYASYKYEPQQGLPRFVIIDNDNNLTTMQLYPAPSQIYTLFVYGKFELPILSINGDMSGIPAYQELFLSMAVARWLAIYKSRSAAWTAKLENLYDELKKDIEGVSTVNLVIDTDNESYLNGSWRVRAGV